MTAEPNETVLPLAEETLRIDKIERETGRVRVSVRTETVDEVVRETLRSSSAELRRVAVGREIAEVPLVREENGVTIVPVVEEILVVVKKLYLKEEIHISYNNSEDIVEQTLQRRVQRAVIDRIPPEEVEEHCSERPVGRDPVS
jgi:stress response protein YsnF